MAGASMYSSDRSFDPERGGVFGKPDRGSSTFCPDRARTSADQGHPPSSRTNPQPVARGYSREDRIQIQVNFVSGCFWNRRTCQRQHDHFAFLPQFLQRGIEGGLWVVERCEADLPHLLMGPARHDIHADARLHGRDSSRFVSPENELALNSIEQILRTRRGMHPALERFLSIALEALGHENQDATIAHEVAGVLERLLRLVHVDVFGKATAAGDDDI